MSIILTSPTADPFGIASTFPEKLRRVAKSNINVTLLDETIRSVLASWDEYKVAPMGRFADVPAEHIVGRPYPESPLDAVEYVRDALQVSQDAVLNATGVAERTFFNWKKNPDSRPRPTSVAKLWQMVEALYYLHRAHPNIAAWFHTSPRAQEAFAAGSVNRLLQLELEWVNANSAGVLERPVPFFGDPGDPTDQDDEGVGVEAAMSAAPRPQLRKVRPRPAKLPAPGADTTEQSR